MCVLVYICRVNVDKAIYSNSNFVLKKAIRFRQVINESALAGEFKQRKEKWQQKRK